MHNRTTVSCESTRGASLKRLKLKQVIRARAPVGVLVSVDDLDKISEAYNRRNSKSKLKENLEYLVWQDTFTLEDSPCITKRGRVTVTDETP